MLDKELKEAVEKAVDEVVDEALMGQVAKGGNYPWDEKRITSAEVEPEIERTVEEVVECIERGTVFVEGRKNHPYIKNTFTTLLADRPGQPYIEAKITIPYHVIDRLQEKVQKIFENKKITPTKTISVLYELYNKSVRLEKKEGIVDQYTFKEFVPGQGSIIAVVLGRVKW